MPDNFPSQNTTVTAVIETITPLGTGVVKIACTDSPVIYTRPEYIKQTLSAGMPITEELFDRLGLAGQAYLAECKAIRLLNYAENSRFMLEVKLGKKGCDKRAVAMALDFLQSDGSLSDERFAECWVRSRIKRHYEGRQVLFGKLLTKGISTSAAQKAIDKAFEEISEFNLCEQAYKLEAVKTDDQSKVFSKLIKRGFSSATIRQVVNAD